MQERCNRCHADLATGANYCARCGALVATESEELVHDPLLGRVLLGRYRVQRVLGEGGMGRVYLAEQAMGQATRPVAIKALRKELVRDPKGSGRFQRESEIVIRLAHPNTIQFHDFGQLDDGTPVIVMEYIEGRTLAEALRDGALPYERVRALLVQICGSLAEAHAHGFVHRDLKPHNILLTSRAGHTDFVKVLDFGIALQQADPEYDATRLTTQGTLMGTPPYMSPEQFQGQPVDARCDVYALGVIAYEMLSGELPFDAKTPWQWAAAHVDQAPKALAEDAGAGAIPAHSIEAVMRALSKDPAQRPADAGALLHEFLGTDAPARDDIVLSLTPRASAQPEREAPAVDESPMATTRRARRARTRSSSRWVLAVIALSLIGAAALFAGSRQRADRWKQASANDADASATTGVASDLTDRQRSRAMKRHAPETRASEGGSTDDGLSALAARADQLHAVDDGTETATNTALAAANGNDDAAKVRAAIDIGQLGVAATLLAAAEHRPGADSAALVASSARLSEAVVRSAIQLSAAHNCAGLARLSEQLRSAPITPPAELISALDACPKAKGSSTDGGLPSTPAGSLQP